MAKAVKIKRKPHGYDLDPDKKLVNGVTAKEEIFCQTYLVSFSIAKAAVAANISKEYGYAYIRKPHIQKRIAQIRNDVTKSLDITRETILQELMKIVYNDPRNYFEKTGRTKNPHKWEEENATAVAGLDFDIKGQVKTIRSHDKLKAIEILAKMLGFNAPDVKKIELQPIAIDRKELIEAAKLLDGLI